MDRILLVGCGGFIGAVLRYLVSLGTQRLLGTPLYATFTVNVVSLNLPHPTPSPKPIILPILSDRSWDRTSTVPTTVKVEVQLDDIRTYCRDRTR